MRATLVADAYHAILRMLLAEHWYPAADDTKTGLRDAGVMCATLTIDDHHAVLSVFLTVHCRLAAFDIKPRKQLTLLIETMPHCRHGRGRQAPRRAHQGCSTQPKDNGLPYAHLSIMQWVLTTELVVKL